MAKDFDKNNKETDKEEEFDEESKVYTDEEEAEIKRRLRDLGNV